MNIVHWSKFNYERRIVENGVPAVATSNLLGKDKKKIEGVWCVPFHADVVQMWKGWATVNGKAVVVHADVPVENIVVIVNGEVVGEASSFTDAELVDICKDSKNGLFIPAGIPRDQIEGVSLVFTVEWE